MRLCIAALMLGLLGGASCRAGEAAPWAWSVTGDEEISDRSYLLVQQAEGKPVRELRVRSQCRKPRQAEGAYGSCRHRVDITPDARTLTLDGGEDVVLVAVGWRMPGLLATLEYGCCGGPWTATLYTLDGTALGTASGYGEGSEVVGANLITRSFDFHNVTRFRDRSYLLVAPPGSRDGARVLQAIDLGGDVRAPLPLRMPAPPAGCADWELRDFTAYGDRADITLKLHGVFCGDGDPTVVLSCLPAPAAIECAPRAGGD